LAFGRRSATAICGECSGEDLGKRAIGKFFGQHTRGQLRQERKAGNRLERSGGNSNSG
jgi:hypothetical protein